MENIVSYAIHINVSLNGSTLAQGKGREKMSFDLIPHGEVVSNASFKNFLSEKRLHANGHGVEAWVLQRVGLGPDA